MTAIIDNRLANEGTTVEQGIRVDGQYRYDGAALGRWTLSFAGNYLLVDGTSFQTYFPQVANVANTIAEPPKFRLHGGISWQQSIFGADLMLNHTSAYQNTLFSPTQNIASWTTEDFTVKATLPEHANEPWRGLGIVLNIQNLTDRRPPFLSIPAGDIAIGRSMVPFDGTNASALGRYISLQIRKQW